MNLGWGVWARALLFAAALGLAWSAVGLMAYGTYQSLIPSMGIVGAAFLAALMCVVVAALLATALVIRTSAPLIETRLPVAAPAVEGNTIVKALSQLAQDHPLMAVACAAILGATTVNGAKRHH